MTPALVGLGLGVGLIGAVALTQSRLQRPYCCRFESIAALFILPTHIHLTY